MYAQINNFNVNIASTTLVNNPIHQFVINYHFAQLSVADVGLLSQIASPANSIEIGFICMKYPSTYCQSNHLDISRYWSLSRFLS